MIIKILGKTKAMESVEIKYATAFFAHYLMGLRLAKGLTIHVVMREDKTKKTYGQAIPIDMFERRPKIFVVAIEPRIGRNKFLQILAHEMVHVKQYAKGEMSVGFSNVKYNGKSYKLTESTEDYYNYPWEIEAFGRDRSLPLFYRSALKEEKITFKGGKVYIDGKMIRSKKAK